MVKVATRTKQESSTPAKLMVLHNLTNNDHTLPHPMQRYGVPAVGITVPARGYLPMNMKADDLVQWQESAEIDDAVERGILAIEWYESARQIPKVRKIAENIPDPFDRQTVENIIYNPNDEYILDVINMTPRKANTSDVDIRYLKDNHLPLLREARKYLAAGVGRVYRLGNIDARIQVVAEM